MNLLIKGGRIIDPANKVNRVADLLIKDGKIAKIGSNLSGSGKIVAKGLIVSPGFVDMHTHFRKP